jgi:integral membrane protein (TIGR00529 family)
LSLFDPIVSVVVSLCFLIVLLYKRVNLGIVLNATAILLALIGVEWSRIPAVLYATSVDQLTLSIVLATFGIMLLSQLYKETRLINRMSESLSRIINNPKIVIGVLPAVLGLLPVAGGALMSAPLVDSEAEKLELKPERKAYLNLWFRHTIFPVYPISQFLIITAALTGMTVTSLVLRQIPVVMVMVLVGYVIGFWKLPKSRCKDETVQRSDSRSNLKGFLVAFSPILATIVVAVCLGLSGFGLSKAGFDVLIAIVVGLLVLIMISKVTFPIFLKPFKSWGIYGITAAAYGAFLLRNTMDAAGISSIFKTFVTGGNVDIVILLVFIPMILAFMTGSPSGGVAAAISILAGVIAFSSKNTSLIYMSAYLGYTMAPTHLCLAFTVDYFKTTLGKVYKYVIPSILATYAATLAIYVLF